MKNKKEVKQELRKIEDAFSQMEQFSARSGFSLDDFMLNYNFPDIGTAQREAINRRTQSRQRVFELSQNKGTRKNSEKVQVRKG